MLPLSPFLWFSARFESIIEILFIDLQCYWLFFGRLNFHHNEICHAKILHSIQRNKEAEKKILKNVVLIKIEFFLSFTSLHLPGILVDQMISRKKIFHSWLNYLTLCQLFDSNLLSIIWWLPCDWYEHKCINMSTIKLVTSTPNFYFVLYVWTYLFVLCKKRRIIF